MRARLDHTGAARWWVVGASGLVVFMASIDLSIVNLALPVIQEELAAPTSTAQWVLLAYLLPLIALTLPSGRWLDGVGQREAFALSVGGFTVASIAVGVAPDIGWLIIARFAHGMCAAVLLALVPALIARAAPEQVRGRAMGLVDMLGAIGLAAGPAAGGVLVETVGWRGIFLLNVPLGLAVLAAGLPRLATGRPLRWPEHSWAVETALVGGAVAAVLLGLSLTAGGNPLWLLLVPVAAPLLVTWCRRPGSAPVLTVARTPGLAGPLVALAATATATGVVLLVLPYHLVRSAGLEPAMAGAVVAAFPLAMTVTGPVAGLLADRTGAPRVAAAGVATFGAGLLLLAPLDVGDSPAELVWRLAVLGIGLGLFNGPNMAVAMSRAPGALVATTGATTSLVRQLGFALGPALATTAWALSTYQLAGLRGALGLAAGLTALGLLVLVWADPAGR